MAEQEKQTAIKLATGNGIANVAQDRNPWATGGEGNAENVKICVELYYHQEEEEKDDKYTIRASTKYGPTPSPMPPQQKWMMKTV